MTSPPTSSSDSPVSSSASSSAEPQPSSNGQVDKPNGSRSRSPLDVVSPRTRNAVALVITAVWALTLLAPLAFPKFVPSPYASFAMLTMAGAIFGSNFIRNGPPE